MNSLIFADESRWLISHSTTPATQELRIWDLSKPNPQAGVRKLSNIVSVAAANNFGKLVAVDTDKRVKLFDLANQNLRDSVQVLGTHEFDAVTALGKCILSPDARWLVTACQTLSPTESIRIYVWDLHAVDIAKSCQMFPGRQFMHGNGLVIDATNRWLVSAGGFSVNEESNDETVTVWDLHARDIDETARTIRRKGDVWQVAVSPNCEWMFTARSNGDVQLWDMRKGRHVAHPLSHCGQSADISSDGRWLAAGGRTQSNIFLFDLTAEEPWNSARVLRGHEAPVWSLAFSDDSRWLVTDSSDGSVRRWCMDTAWLVKFAKQMAARELTQDERAYHGLEQLSTK